MNRVFGVTKEADTYSFFTYQKGAKECFVNLYNEDKEIPFYTCQLRPVGTRGLFCIDLLTGKDLPSIKDDFYYTYQVDGVETSDRYAKAVSGSKDFGKETSESVRKSKYLEIGEPAKAYSKNELIDSVFYQLSVRGFTKSDSADVKNPGTFDGLLGKAQYIGNLGVNAIMLLPCYDYNEVMVNKKINFWGYTEDAFYFAPKASFAADKSNPSGEFKRMVEGFHERHIDVYMEMFFGHTERFDFIRDCLLFWSNTYGIDGFRVFVSDETVSRLLEDPMLGDARIIAGNYAQNLLAYKDDLVRYGFINEAYTTDVRRYLKGEEATVEAFYHCFKEKGDQIGFINRITSYDGFTLADLVSYDVRHNEANGEFGTDGVERNYSYNCGVEGETKDKKVLELRYRCAKNSMLLFLLSQGIPMLRAGDEFLQTQKGNNNAYCQDNEISWLNWNLAETNKEFTEFVKTLLAFRKQNPVYRYKKKFRETDYCYTGTPDISLHGLFPWKVETSFYARACMVMINGKYDGVRGTSKDILIVSNMFEEEREFALPDTKEKNWTIELSTCNLKKIETDSVVLPKKSTVLLTK